MDKTTLYFPVYLMGFIASATVSIILALTVNPYFGFLPVVYLIPIFFVRFK